MDPVTHQSLSSLLKHYAALTPSTASLIPSTDQGGPFPRCDTLSLAATQQWFVDHLIPLVRDRRGESSETSHERAWRKGFWKRVVNGIEQGFQDRIRRDSNGQESVQDEVSPCSNTLPRCGMRELIFFFLGPVRSSFFSFSRPRKCTPRFSRQWSSTFHLRPGRTKVMVS